MQSFLNFLGNFFQTYDITTEIVMLIVIAILKAIVVFSKPEKTYLMQLFNKGIFFASLSMILHICMLAETIRMRTSHGYAVFNILYVCYSISYIIELLIIFTYQTQLSYKRRAQQKHVAMMRYVFGAIWLVMLMAPLVRGRLLSYSDGIYSLTKYSDAYVLCSFICALIVAGVTYANRNDVSRIVYVGSIIFVPLDVIGVFSQLYFHTAYFICATYTLPFLIYYILFHAAKYDEVTGCQGKSAYRAFLKRNIINNQNYILISAFAPTLDARNLVEIESIVAGVANTMSRSIEKVDSRIRVYSMTSYDYNIICPVETEEEGENIKKRLLEILLEPVVLNGNSYKVPLNILIAKRYECIESVEEQLALVNTKRNEFWYQDVDQIKEISDKDAESFKRHILIEKALLEIKYNNNNLDDERVIVYVQPIYKISGDNFKTGESLMRMKIDGKLVFPDEFIPIAERIGCIHVLTRIMLYKAAKLAVQLKDTQDFSALTVNVSTIEMTEPNVAEEFMGIIKRAGASPECIRMEITESTAIQDYGVVVDNIMRLVKMGIQFYLDDFGTGYSNLDRVISIPFKTIKFDKSLLYKAMSDKKTEELFMFLANFFKEKDLHLVVEGVETEEQKEYVKKAGFDYIQGYIYSKPVPALDVRKFFE